MDKRVKAVVSFYPALCDLAGYTKNRAGGWPHIFKENGNQTPKKLQVASYYDTVNFARQIPVPVFCSFGYNDMTCPPTTTYSAYNVINSPKELFIAENTSHYTYPEQMDIAWKWITKQLTDK